MGFLNYFKNFVPNFSEKTLFLTDMLAKDKKIDWTAEKEEKLKEVLRFIEKKIKLRYPDPSKEFILETDASDRAIGAALKQDGEPISFYSYKFSKTELKYTSMEKEMLGILKSLENFRSILIPGKVIIYSDNQNLIFDKDLSRRIQRWKMLMQEYDYEIKKIEGKKNVLADTLSRITLMNTKNQAQYWNFSKLIKMQKDDCSASQLSDNQDKTKTIKGILTDERNRIIIPQNYLKGLLLKLHSDLAHPGSKKLYKTLNDYVYARNLKAEVEKITYECLECQRNKGLNKKYGKYTGSLFSEVPFEYISSDIFGPIKTLHFETEYSKEYFYLLTITDIYSRFTRVFDIEDIKTETIISQFKKWLELYHTPKKILTDLGRQYISNTFERFLKSNCIKHIQTSPYNPTANGISERINSTIKNILRIYKGKLLKDVIAKIETNLNFTYHSIMKTSPFEILHGYSIFEVTNKNNNKCLDLKQAEKNRKIKDQEKKNRERIDLAIKKGDYVLRKNVVQDKILDKFLGLFQVVEVNKMRGNVWVDEGNRIVRHNWKNLKSYRGRGECQTPLDIFDDFSSFDFLKFLENFKYKNKSHNDPHASTKVINYNDSSALFKQ
ncbi:Transposon Tf2-8 polyprotein [Dictyocoela muelleri]|nr:Transposon Tf2-8 polyprotein [Dictyocoela muelleri]